jgi:hypothetical protein
MQSFPKSPAAPAICEEAAMISPDRAAELESLAKRLTEVAVTHDDLLAAARGSYERLRPHGR